MYVTERFLDGFVKVQGEHPVSIYGGSWYPQANGFLKLDHHLRSFLAKKREKFDRKENAVYQG
jgi:hypothetical protein